MSNPEINRPAALDRVFVGDSELARLMRDFDWASTSIGPPEFWPQSLKTAVHIMLTSRQPIWIGWGEELIYLYNDPYKSIIGGKHPWALGRPTSVVWREIWGDIGPMLAKAMGGDSGTYVEAQLLIMERNGYPEETYYTFSYSPIPRADGAAGGIFCANTDDTQRVIGERQLALLRDLAAGTVDARTWQQACRRSARALATNPRDLPFALLYSLEPENGRATLAGITGIAAAHPAAPAEIALDRPHPWPIAEVLRSHRGQVVELARAFNTAFPSGAWDEPPKQAVALPIPQSGETGRAGVLIAGLNPFRLFDERFASFLDLVAGQIGAAIGNAEAYEQERRRAEALAEIDRAKTAFFSNVSHEFRTPLTLMLGPLEEALSKPQAADGSRELISVAHRNGVRLLKLVNTLLDFSRIEAGRVQGSFEPVDLALVSAEIASTFRSAIDAAGLTLVLQAAPLPQPVYIDRDLWEKILLNLLSNAFKFTFEGEIAVIIAPAADGQHAEVTVRDTGTGIPQQELPHLFERFRRVEGARGRSFEGSGIGLALVQELVRLHGGEIRVESEIGRGSAFTVTLPFGNAHLPAAQIGGARRQVSTNVRAQAYVDEAMGWLGETTAGELPAPSASDDLGGAAPGVKGRGELVLLADDNVDMRHYVQRLLEASGFRVAAAADGEAALALARQAKPDLVLSDVMMPKLDGFELVAALRKEPALHGTPVLLLSARAGEEERVAGLTSGADDYLVKPFSTRELLARVQSNLQLARVRNSAEATLKEEAEALQALHRVSLTIAAQTGLEAMVQVVTDAATQLSGAEFGSFFYNVIDQRGESYQLYTLSGAPREAFSKFPMPRNTAVFGPTFRAEGIVRSGDITKDPRYGKNEPYRGMPEGHLPVRSYLAVPVVSPSGEVHGGLFFGHSKADVFTDRAERLVTAIAAMAAVAIDKARLFEEAQREIAERKRVEALRAAQNRVLELAIGDTPLHDALDTLVRDVEAQSDAGMLGSILLLDEGRLRHGAAPSLPEAYNKVIDGIAIGPNVGSCGTAAYTGNPVYVSDIATDPLWANFRDLALSHGLRACWSTPILSGHGEVLGTFAMYYRQPREPTPVDLELVDLVTRSASLVIERRRSEFGLKRLASVVETSSDFIGYASLDGSALYVNTAGQKLVGLEPDQVKLVRIPDFLPPEWQERFATDVLPSVLKTGYWQGEVSFRNFKTGALIDVSQAVFTAPDPQTGKICFATVARDITERKNAETALRELNETLERRVADALAEQAKIEEQLRQAQKMESIGQLTGGVAHDFNNLLTVVIGNLDAMQRQLRQGEPDRARLERSTDLALRGARRAETLTHRLLAFSRQQPLDPKPIDLGRLVTGMSDLLRRTIGEQIAVETVLGGGLWRAFADPNQLEVAVLNLAVNARDAMPQGGRLTIETANVMLDERYAAAHTEVLPGQYVMLAVSDTGVGMSREVLARVFEPFFTTKDVGHGTGLGLSQVYGFVKQSGGHIQIYSEPGAGTAVKIYLPRLHSDEVAPMEEPSAPVPIGAGSETILAVEDDADVRAFTTETLRELGYRVLEASNGQAGLRVLDEHPEIALLFTDVGLPGGVNGRQLADAARARRPDLKVLFTTGYARNAIVHEGRLDPGVDLVTKPFSQAAVAAKLRELLDARSDTPRILVVEDEALLQMLAVDVLEDAGYKVDTAGSAREALNKLKLIPGGPDAVVVDIGLPDARGDVLVREIRAIYPYLPVVIASGRDQAELRASFGGEAKLEIMQKPYAAAALLSVLRRLGLRGA